MKLNLYYIAGLFDGEGSVSIIHQRDNRHKNGIRVYHLLSVNITNTNESVLNAIRETLGFGMVRKKKVVGSSSNTKHIFVYEVRSNGAGKFLDLIKDMVIIKKERVKVGLDFQTRLHIRSHQYMTQREWVHNACDEMRRLNTEFGSSKRLTYCKYRIINEKTK